MILPYVSGCQPLALLTIIFATVIKFFTIMPKVFKVTPKRIKRSNGLVLTPDMSIVVTTRSHMNSPFCNGAKELKEAYMRIYGFDYTKACCQQGDFTYEILG